MTTFDERERAFENLFAHDEEVRFQILARRNKALAAWAAAQIDKTKDVKAYQDDIVAFALTSGSDDLLAERIVEDLGRAGRIVSVSDVQATMLRLQAEAVVRETTAR